MHGIEYVKVEDMHLDMARSQKLQYRQKSQAATHMLRVKQSNKRSRFKVYMRIYIKGICTAICVKVMTIKSK